MSLADSLQRIREDTLARVEPAHVVRVALGLWYEQDVAGVSRTCTSEELARMVERFARLCPVIERKLVLYTDVRPYLPEPDTKEVWTGLQPLMHYLLPLQTRHFMAEALQVPADEREQLFDLLAQRVVQDASS